MLINKMNKLTKETFDLLQDGLDMLITVASEEEYEELNERIAVAEDELIAIGTY